jgi:hypothetical protein
MLLIGVQAVRFCVNTQVAVFFQLTANMVKGFLIIHPYGWRRKMFCHTAIITVRFNQQSHDQAK